MRSRHYSHIDFGVIRIAKFKKFFTFTDALDGKLVDVGNTIKQIRRCYEN